MAARPQRRAPTVMPATVSIGDGYMVALWSEQTPRVFAMPTTGKRRGSGRPHPVELRLRRDLRHRWQPCLTLRVTLSGRQVSRTLLRLLEQTCVMRPASLPPGWVLFTADGTCSVGSLRWVSAGDAQRLRRWGAKLDQVVSRTVALRGDARACCRSNDATVDLTLSPQ